MRTKDYGNYLSIGVCPGCNTAIAPKEGAIEVFGTNYHSDCLRGVHLVGLTPKFIKENYDEIPSFQEVAHVAWQRVINQKDLMAGNQVFLREKLLDDFYTAKAEIQAEKVNVIQVDTDTFFYSNLMFLYILGINGNIIDRLTNRFGKFPKLVQLLHSKLSEDLPVINKHSGESMVMRFADMFGLPLSLTSARNGVVPQNLSY